MSGLDKNDDQLFGNHHQSTETHQRISGPLSPLPPTPPFFSPLLFILLASARTTNITPTIRLPGKITIIPVDISITITTSIMITISIGIVVLIMVTHVNEMTRILVMFCIGAHINS